MPLINLTTNLKSLKFGNDQSGGGSSNQPYTQTTVPATDEPLQTELSVSGDNIGKGLGTTAFFTGGGAAAGAAIGALVSGAPGAGIGAIAGTIIGAGIGLGVASDQGFKIDNINILSSSGTGGTDFLIRGGTLLPNVIFSDITRLSKFFQSTNGVLFITKQNLLSKSAVRTQTSKGFFNERAYTPLGTLIQAGGNAFGIHVNKQGLNSFDGTGPTSKNEDLYGVKVKPTQPTLDNRLADLYGAKFLTLAGATIKKEYLKDDISEDPLKLFSYRGGPGSVLGIGKTNIILSNPTTKPNYLTSLLNNKVNYLTLGYPELSDYFSLKPPTFIKGTTERIGPQGSNIGIINGLSTFGASILPPLGFNVSKGLENPDPFINPREFKYYIPSQFQNDFRKNLILAIAAQDNSITTIMSSAPSYDPIYNKTIEQRVRLGDPGNANGKNLFSYTSGSAANADPTLQGPLGAASVNSYDKINVLPIYSSATPPSDNNVINDLVQFKIGVYNFDSGSSFNNIHFRAFLNQISDAYTADWNPTRYIGRGENFYTYGGFDRKISLSWTVAAQSKVELMPMYKKLNYLASVCAPNYSANGYMRGNIIKLTIGGYIHDQPGIITGFTYEMNEDNATWEIGIDDDGRSDDSVRELPHLIKVSGFNFIPIHNFAPQIQEITTPITSKISLDKPYIDENAYGKQKFINNFIK